MEFFRNPNIDFLGKKWYFLAFSLVFSVAGLLSMLFWHGIPLGVDFRGGTLVYVKFSHPPNNDAIRAALGLRAGGAPVAESIEQLAAAGEVLAAVKLARARLGLSLTEAKQHVDRLRG